MVVVVHVIDQMLVLVLDGGATVVLASAIRSLYCFVSIEMMMYFF